jgi:carboxypeptidase family protein
MKLASRLRLVLVVAIGVIVFAATFARSQGIVTGSISGVVQDPQGAFVAGAKVSATHLSTNRTFTVQTASAGIVALRDLPPGAYNLRVRKSASASGSGHLTANMHFYAVSLGFDSDS